jgi:uncharacterized protein (TIGR00251 family)
VRIRIRLTPRAGADRLAGIAEAADGSVLKASVAAPAEAGRANAALVELLARACRVARREVAIIGGQKSRNKLVHVAGDPELLRARLAAALAAATGDR